MKRTQIYLTDKQYDFYKEESSYIGISMAERIRQILENHMQKVIETALQDIKHKKGES